MRCPASLRLSIASSRLGVCRLHRRARRGEGKPPTGAAAARIADSRTSTLAKVATWHTKIRYLAYVLGASSVLQSVQSSSRVHSDFSPSKRARHFAASANGPGPSGVRPCRCTWRLELRLNGVYQRGQGVSRNHKCFRKNARVLSNSLEIHRVLVQIRTCSRTREQGKGQPCRGEGLCP